MDSLNLSNYRVGVTLEITNFQNSSYFKLQDSAKMHASSTNKNPKSLRKSFSPNNGKACFFFFFLIKSNDVYDIILIMTDTYLIRVS